MHVESRDKVLEKKSSFSTLKMEILRFSETSVTFYRPSDVTSTKPIIFYITAQGADYSVKFL